MFGACRVCTDLFARLVFLQLKRPPEPPPLNLLRVPSMLCLLALRLIVFCLPKKTSADRPAVKMLLKMRTFFAKAFEYSPVLEDNVRIKGGEYVGLSSFENWKVVTEGDLSDVLCNFVAKRFDDVQQEQDHSWRSKMMKRIGSQVEQVGARLEKQQKELEKQQKEAFEVIMARLDAIGGGQHAGTSGSAPAMEKPSTPVEPLTPRLAKPGEPLDVKEIEG